MLYTKVVNSAWRLGDPSSLKLDSQARGRGWLWISGLMLVIVLGALVLMPTLPLSAIGRFLIVADPLEPADAILPLAGDMARVVHAASFYRERLAPQLIVTDMALTPNIPTNYAEQAHNVLLALGIPGAAISLIPGRATTTFEEAVNACAMARAKGWTSLIVVTSPTHTRRSQTIFRNVCHGIKVMVQPSPPHWHREGYRLDPWWRSPQGRREVGLEYLKLALYYVGIR